MKKQKNSVLKKFVLIAAPTLRTKAYLHLLNQSNIHPEYIFLLSGNEEKFKIKKTKLILNNKIKINLELVKSLDNLLEQSKSCIVRFNFHNLENRKLLNTLNKFNLKYAIYSGFPGKIISKKLINSNIKWIHCHGGRLPDYKGSTTFYYSILEIKCFYVSVIFLDENIDTGKLIKQIRFSHTNNKNFDEIVDPFSRAYALCNVLNHYTKYKKFFKNKKSKVLPNRTFFVIHPILKFIASNYF